MADLLQIRDGKVEVRKSDSVLVAGRHVGKLVSAALVPHEDAEALKFSIDRSQWTDPGVKVRMEVEISFDGGKTWQPFCHCTSQGGAEGGETYMLQECPKGGIFRTTTTVEGELQAAAKVEFY